MFCAGIGGKKMSGAKWVRVDFHLHSPASSSFSLPSGLNLNSPSDIEKLVDEYVKKLKEANIKIAAITDYNLIRKEWFELIRNKAKAFDIIIFPGVELYVGLTGGKYGLHILIIFEENEKIEGINTFIQSLDKNPQDPLVEDRKHRRLESKYELEDLILEIRKRFSCLIIFPHPDEDDNGIFKTFNPLQAAKYIKNIKPDAIEKFSDSIKSKLLSTGELTKEELERIAQIENSDPKSLEEIGNKKRGEKIKATYLKLSDFSLNAIKLALHDPSVRVALYYPPEMIHDRIVRISINGSFLKDISLSFNPEMNTLIGGRGVGKSAILETIRYGLGLPVYSDPEYRINFVREVVGSGGIIEILIKKYYGKEERLYTIRRTRDKEVEIYDENGEKRNISVETLFEGKVPVIIGQKELYYVAKDPKFRLRLVDELIGEEVKNLQKEFNELIEKLKINGDELIKLKKKISKKDEYEQELKSIKEEIKIFEELGVTEKLKKLTNVISDDELIKDGFEKIKNAKEKIQEMKDYIEGEFNSLIERLSRPKTCYKTIEKIQKICEEFKQYTIRALDDLLEETDKFKEKYKKEIKEWEEYKFKVESEVEKIKRELGSQKVKPERLEELTRRKAFLEPRIDELKRTEAQLFEKKKERGKLKQLLGQKRHELYQIRKKKLEEINKKLKERLKLDAEFESERSEFAKRFKALLAGSGIHKNAVESILTSNLAIDGLLLSEYFQEGKEKIMEKFALTENMAEKLIAWFNDEERLFELETLFPEDKIIIKLKVNNEYKELEKLSDGQKATALLLLLFAQEDRILILDQPEEDLDNRFIYEDVVKILRDYKSKRQFIIATHNANIPVIGDSEQIIVLESEEDRCKIVDTGSVDKMSIRNHVKNIMEGGEEAFRLRVEKYGGI